MDIIVRILNFVLMIVLPLLLGSYLAREYRLPWRLFWIGAVTFVGSQVLHIPFNAWALNPLVKKLGLSTESALPGLIVLGVLYGLSAGVFEETARYIVYRRWLSKVRTWREGLMFGAGHGGIEAILLGALAALAFVQAVVLRNADLSAMLPAEQIDLARVQLETYWGAPWYAALLGALERVFALCVHLSAAVMVLQVFRRNNIAWLFISILWHTAVNAAAVVSVSRIGPYATEGVIFVFALFSLLIVYLLRDDDIPVDEGDAPLQPGVAPLPNIGETDLIDESLEESRYAE